MITEKLGIFQVKYSWNDMASIKLINQSCEMLTELACKEFSSIFDLNFPGIGNGHLNYNQVFPIIKRLPDNVFVWQYKEPHPVYDTKPKEDGEAILKELGAV